MPMILFQFSLRPCPVEFPDLVIDTTVRIMMSLEAKNWPSIRVCIGGVLLLVISVLSLVSTLCFYYIVVFHNLPSGASSFQLLYS